jgi:hypothetical protein
MGDEKIELFWDWFSSIANKFGERFENQGLVHELDLRICGLGPIAWEIGPGLLSPDYASLVFSPAGERSLIPLTEEIVAQAPDCRGWEFYSCRPAKKWQRIFLVEDDTDNEYRVDASKWEYILLRYDDGFFDVLLECPSLAVVPDSLYASIGEILVEGEVGEKLRLDCIDRIECFKSFDDRYKGKGRPIEQFAMHLGQSRFRNR